MYGCNVCGGRMIGDGLHSPLRCENYELPEGVEADSGPWYCETPPPAKEKFTPGPWQRFDNGGQAGSGHVYGEHYAARVWGPRGPGYGLVADCHQGRTDEDLANAKLVAAAPDLYDALDTLVAIVGMTAFKHESQRSVLQDAVDLAIAALKEARGEQ